MKRIGREEAGTGEEPNRSHCIIVYRMLDLSMQDDMVDSDPEERSIKGHYIVIKGRYLVNHDC